MKRPNISEIELTEIAKITGTHGYKGSLLLKFNIDLERILEKELFFIKIEGIIVPFFVSDNKIYPHKKQSAIVKFEKINTNDEAKKLISYFVYIDKKNISDKENDFFDKIINFDVFDNNNFIGKVDEYLQIPSNPILKVRSKNNTEILVPVNKDFLIKIDETCKKIFFNLPDGLIDINN